MSLTSRIRIVCENKKIKNIDLVDIGCGSQQTVSFVLNGKQKPNSQFLETFLKHYSDINARWLMTGEEGMYLLNEPQSTYGYCADCVKKEAVIKYQEKIIKEKDQKIEELIGQCAELRGKLEQVTKNKAS